MSAPRAAAQILRTICEGAVGCARCRRGPRRSFIVAENRLEPVQVVALGEFLETLSRLAMPQVAFQHLLQRPLELLDRDSVKHLPADGLVRAEAASNENVVAFDGFARNLDL